jgi:hypothetical protein
MMDKSGKRLPDLQPWKRGELLRAEKLNDTVETVNSLTRGVDPPRQILRSPPTETTTGDGAPPLRLYTCTGLVGDEWVECVRGHTTDGEPVKVAKPPHLRVSFWDGATRRGIMYTKTSATQRRARAPDPGGTGHVIQAEVLIPSYQPGDPLHVATMSADDIGLVVQIPNPDTDPEAPPTIPHDVTLVDANVAARQYAREWVSALRTET